MFRKTRTIQGILLFSYIFLILTLTLASSFLYYSGNKNTMIEITNKSTKKYLSELNRRIDSDIMRFINMSGFITKDENIRRLTEKYPEQDERSQFNTENIIKKYIKEPLGYQVEVVNFNVFLKGKKSTGAGINSVYSYNDFIEMGLDKITDDLEQTLIDTNRLDNYTYGFPSGTNPYAISILTSIRSSKNEISGYLSVDIGEAYVYNLLNSSKTSKNSDIFFLNNKGEVISAYSKSLIGSVLPAEGLDVILSSRTGGYEMIKYKNSKHTMIYTDSASHGWRIVEMIPAKDLYMGFEDIRNTAIFIALIFMLFIVPMSVVFSNYISKPIIEISKIMSDYKEINPDMLEGKKMSGEIITLYRSYKRMRENISELTRENIREHELRHQSEIDTLQAQINPHFLYNTLDTINWSAEEQGAGNISEMIVMLSKLLRIGLNKGQKICTMESEIQHVKLYMELQKTSTVDSFDYEIKIEEGIEKLFIPKLIMQPLVENSILHGFERMDDGGIIKINGYIKENKLFIVIEDNGKGMTNDEMSEVLVKDSKKRGYGVKNVHQRIQYLCGNNYGITYSGNKNGGTAATIMLPVVEEIEELTKEGI